MKTVAARGYCHLNGFSFSLRGGVTKEDPQTGGEGGERRGGGGERRRPTKGIKRYYVFKLKISLKGIK